MPHTSGMIMFFILTNSYLIARNSGSSIGFHSGASPLRRPPDAFSLSYQHKSFATVARGSSARMTPDAINLHSLALRWVEVLQRRHLTNLVDLFEDRLPVREAQDRSLAPNPRS